MFDQPPMQSPGEPAPLGPASNLPEKNYALRKLLLVILSVTGVLVIGGGVFAYFQYFRQTPEKILGKMMQNISLVKSLEYSGEAKVSYEVDNNLVQTYTLGALEMPVSSSTKLSQAVINFSGASDYNNSDNIKNSFSFAFSSDNELEKGVALGLEIIGLDKLVYFKINSLPSSDKINLDFLKNQWVKISPDSLKSDLGLEDEPAASSTKSLLTDKIIKITSLFKTANIFSVGTQLPDENINGVDSYHYQLAVNRDKLLKFLIDASEIANSKKVTEAERTEVVDALAKVDFSNLEIWVDKKEYLPTKLFLTINSLGVDGQASDKKASLIISFKNFNKSLEIKAPESSKSIQEMLGQFFTVIMSSSAELNSEIIPEAVATSTLAFDSDNDGLSDQDEKNYMTDLNNPDTDGDGFLDGAEVKSGYNPNGPGKLSVLIDPSQSSNAILNLAASSAIESLAFGKNISKDCLPLDLVLTGNADGSGKAPLVKFSAQGITENKCIVKVLVLEGVYFNHSAICRLDLPTKDEFTQMNDDDYNLYVDMLPNLVILDAYGVVQNGKQAICNGDLADLMLVEAKKIK